MLDARTAIGFSLSCMQSEMAHTHHFEGSHLEGIVAGGSLGYCGSHFESRYSK
jgi:hypothetical protein